MVFFLIGVKRSTNMWHCVCTVYICCVQKNKLLIGREGNIHMVSLKVTICCHFQKTCEFVSIEGTSLWILCHIPKTHEDVPRLHLSKLCTIFRIASFFPFAHQTL